MNYSINTISVLNEEFENVKFDFKEIEFLGILPCYFIYVNSENILSEIWTRVSDIIAVEYQAKLADEFSLWNIYLFYIVKNPISNNLKYQIENDIFSSRKIVIDNDYSCEIIIEKHIVNNDIVIKQNIENDNSFDPDPLIYDVVKDMEAKKVTDEVKMRYDSILKKLKDNNHEN